MNILKKSLLISTSLLGIVHGTLAMHNPSEEDNTKGNEYIPKVLSTSSKKEKIGKKEDSSSLQFEQEIKSSPPSITIQQIQHIGLERITHDIIFHGLNLKTKQRANFLQCHPIYPYLEKDTQKFIHDALISDARRGPLPKMFPENEEERTLTNKDEAANLIREACFYNVMGDGDCLLYVLGKRREALIKDILQAGQGEDYNALTLRKIFRVPIDLDKGENFDEYKQVSKEEFEDFITPFFTPKKYLPPEIAFAYGYLINKRIYLWKINPEEKTFQHYMAGGSDTSQSLHIGFVNGNHYQILIDKAGSDAESQAALAQAKEDKARQQWERILAGYDPDQEQLFLEETQPSKKQKDKRKRKSSNKKEKLKSRERNNDFSATLSSLVQPSLPSLQLLPSSEDDPIFILSIDGGGIRGVIPAMLLASIEDRLEAEYNQEIRIASCFDVIAGTSTGGILALGLTTPTESHPQGYLARELLELYENHGEEIFHLGFLGKNLSKIKNLKAPKYNPENLNDVAQEYFGEAWLSDVLEKVNILIPAYDTKARNAYFFKSTEAKKNLKSHNYKIKDIVRATSAAPTYFPAVTIQSENNEEKTFVDGGMTRNNPAEEAYRLAKELHPEAKKFFILSLGTGEVPPTSLPSEEKKFLKGKVYWAPKAHKIMMEDNTRSVDSRLAKKDKSKVKYIRIKPHLHPNDKKMDNPNKSHIAGLRGIANNILLEDGDRPNHEQFELIFPKLKERLRQQGIHPDEWSLPPRIRSKISLLSEGGKLILDGEEVTNKIVRNVIGKLHELNSVAFLSTLKILGTKVDDGVIKDVVDKIVKPYQVKRLVLDGSHYIGKSGLDKLYNLLKDPSKLALRRVSLQDVEAGDDEVYKAVELLAHNPNIVTIRLGRNANITPRAREEVKKLVKNTITFEDFSDAFDSEDENTNKKKL